MNFWLSMKFCHGTLTFRHLTMLLLSNSLKMSSATAGNLESMVSIVGVSKFVILITTSSVNFLLPNPLILRYFSLRCCQKSKSSHKLGFNFQLFYSLTLFNITTLIRYLKIKTNRVTRFCKSHKVCKRWFFQKYYHHSRLTTDRNTVSSHVRYIIKPLGSGTVEGLKIWVGG